MREAAVFLAAALLAVALAAAALALPRPPDAGVPVPVGVPAYPGVIWLRLEQPDGGALAALPGPDSPAEVPAHPGLQELRQPDGSAFQARQWGDERLHGWETAEGYTIVRDENGWWHFARKRDDGSLAGNGIRADRPDLLPEGYPKHLRPGKTESQMQPTGEAVVLLGVAVFFEAGGPHYELLVRGKTCTVGGDGPVPSRCFPAWERYVLVGEAKPRADWLCLVRGRLLEGPNAWKRPAVEAEWIVPLLPVPWMMR